MINLRYRQSDPGKIRVLQPPNNQVYYILFTTWKTDFEKIS